MTPALLAQTCRYTATNFGPAKAGLPAAASGPAGPRFATPNWIFNCQRTLVPAAWAAAAMQQ
jgi:hypothetical protein